jgi:gamma-glutamyltranspeptidase/glutathione hydrolase
MAPGHGRTLRCLAANGFRDFYEGEVADAIVAWAAQTGGSLSFTDLADHRSQWVDPVGVDYRGHRIWELPPNGQGIAALLALGMLERTDLDHHPHHSPRAWHLQVEAMKLAFADSDAFVADPDLVPVPTSGLLDTDYLATRAALIGDQAGPAPRGTPVRGGTVYLCTADRSGQMVSFIQSNYMGFGSGVVVPDYGVSLQNRGAGFVLDPDHPNAAVPGKRPRHTIIPGFVTRDGAPVGPFGVMGGEMQPQGHVQVLSAMLDRGLNPQAALDAPRWQVERSGRVVVEPATPQAVVDGLRGRGHEVRVEPNAMLFGRGQIIVRRDDAYVAGSEPRADGAAVGL